MKDIERLRNLEESGLAEKMRHFYKSRLNRDMVKVLNSLICLEYIV